MTEKDFDKRIREKAMLRENEKEIGLWNKEQVWTQIETGLPALRKKVFWWPAAAIFVLFLLSAGWSVAQYINNQKYKQQKDLEIVHLQSQFNSEKEKLDNELTTLKLKITEKDRQIQEIQKDVFTISREANSNNITDQQELNEEIKIYQDKLSQSDKTIETLKNEVSRLKNFEEQVIAMQNTPVILEKTKDIQTAKPEKHFPSNKIHYLNNIQQQSQSQEKKGFSIKFLNGGKNQNIEYKSEQSLFSK